jgi:hypothetical protein
MKHCIIEAVRVTITVVLNFKVLTVTEKHAVDLGQLYALGKAECPLFVTSNRSIPFQNTCAEVQLCFVLVR